MSDIERKNYLDKKYIETNRMFTPVFNDTLDLYLKYKVITISDFAVLQVLMRYLCRKSGDLNYGYSFITNVGISEILHIDKKTVKKCIKKLADVGLIDVEDNPCRVGKAYKFRFKIYEPLDKDVFFSYFNISEDTSYKDNDYTEGEEDIKPKGADEGAEKPKKEKKEKKPKKTFAEKEVEDWNYPDFIAYFRHKYQEVYCSEYRIPHSYFPKESAKLKSACEKYFGGDKLAFYFYIEEVFKARKQFENQKFPTVNIGLVCTVTNRFKLDKFFKLAKLNSNRDIALEETPKVNEEPKTQNGEITKSDVIEKEEEDKFLAFIKNANGVV